MANKAKLVQCSKNLDRFVIRWVDIMGLSGWRINIRYIKAPEMTKLTGGTLYEAFCTPQWEYKTADLYFNLDEVVGMQVDEGESLVVHELAHCLVSEMRSWEKDSDHEERVVTDIERALMRAKGLQE